MGFHAYIHELLCPPQEFKLLSMLRIRTQSTMDCAGRQHGQIGTCQQAFTSARVRLGNFRPQCRAYKRYIDKHSSGGHVRRLPNSVAHINPLYRSVKCDASSASPSGAQPSTLDDGLKNVVLPTALALLLCNMDRICLSVAIIPMSAEFGWPASLQGVIQSAFLWGYMATQLLGGSLADALGGKKVMAGGMAWFSLASLLLPLALSPAVASAGWAIPAMLAARCAVGLGEGVALPAMNNLVANHIPREFKARALGMCFSGFHAGNLAGLLLSPFLLVNFGWRALFFIFGIIGGPLLAYWWATVPDKPASQPQLQQPTSTANTTGQSSQASTKPVTALTLMSKPATWAIIIVNIINHWGYFIYLNWMPTYFVKALGYDLKSSSIVALLPWIVMACGSSLAGLLADRLTSHNKISVTTVRKALQSVAFIVPAIALIVLSQPGISAKEAVLLMTVALGTTSLGQAGFVANMSDIAPRHAGTMFGLCNTFGSLSGIIGVTAVGFIVEATKSFSTVFQITAGMYLLGTVVWLLFATGEKVFD